MKRTQHRVGCGLLEIGPSMHHKLFPCLPPFQVRWKPMNAYFIVASIATTISNTPVPAIFLFLCVLISRRAFFGRHTTLNLLLDKVHLQGSGYTCPRNDVTQARLTGATLTLRRGRSVQPTSLAQVYFFVFFDLFKNGTAKNQNCFQYVIFTCICHE